MNNKNQKIIHRWDYGRAKPTWTTQSSKNISKVLDHLKLGLNDETTPAWFWSHLRSLEYRPIYR
jgi:hypothetical protein